ncbi:hypothetical protein Bbelb_408390, partial [Branchiostoma belcheri]
GVLDWFFEWFRTPNRTRRETYLSTSCVMVAIARDGMPPQPVRPEQLVQNTGAEDVVRHTGVEEGRRRQQESGGELPKVSRASLSGASVCAELVPTAEIHREGSKKLSLRDSDQLSGAFTRL